MSTAATTLRDLAPEVRRARHGVFCVRGVLPAGRGQALSFVVAGVNVFATLSKTRAVRKHIRAIFEQNSLTDEKGNEPLVDLKKDIEKIAHLYAGLAEDLSDYNGGRVLVSFVRREAEEWAELSEDCGLGTDPTIKELAYRLAQSL